METLQDEISDLHLQVANVKVRVKNDEEELSLLAQILRIQKTSPLKVPVSGVVWSVKAKSGEYVREGETILQILNPETRWVDTFVAEEDAGKLYVGASAKVRVVGDDKQREYPAIIESIRGGVGRVQVGDSMAIPPPELVRREVSVQLGVRWEDPRNRGSLPGQFYDVGRTVEVIFDPHAPQR
jgi:multidrug resistance efflux pump